MSSKPSDARSRFRKNLEDVAVFGTAVVVSVAAILELGVVGLGIGTVLLSIAAAIVVGREESVTIAADDGTVATDGGRPGD